MRRRFALAVIAFHALLLWLLWLGMRGREQREPEQPIIISLSLQPIPPPRATPVRPEPPEVASEPPPPASPRPPEPESPPAPAPEPRTTLQPEAPSPPEAPPPAQVPSAPPIDWARESALTARQFAQSQAQAAQQDTFSPPPKVLSGTCKPKEKSMEWKGKEDRRVGMDGIFPYFRVGKHCVIVLVVPMCTLGDLPEANGHLLDDMDDPDRSRSSVPDPDTCD